MPGTRSSPTEKPVSAVWQPSLVRLPPLTLTRRLARRLVKVLCRGLVALCTRCEVRGLENYPADRAALVTINHLGDADAVVVLANLPDFPEAIAKIELREILPLRWVMDAIGVIYIHRGQPDRRALISALRALREGRRVILAPEGRQSLTGALERGTEGAAFLAIASGVPVVPVALTGTENWRIYGNLKRLRRTRVTLTVGKPFFLPKQVPEPAALAAGTQTIMEALAALLPEEYRGVYGKVNFENPMPEDVT